MTADPRSPLQQAPPDSTDGSRPLEGGNHSATAAPPRQEVERKPVSRSDIWFRRIAVLLFVILCSALGVMLVVLPWSLQWMDNRLLWGYPELKTFLGNGFVRGLCSGVGILDIWIGFREAAHYHEEPRRSGKANGPS